MRIAVIACRVFTRELSYYVSQSPHTVEVFWLPQGLHDTPDRLRRMIADTLGEIDRQREERLLKYSPDAIALAYGLCSNGVVGLESRDVPLIVPRTDDCIAQFLGSQRRYLALFAATQGLTGSTAAGSRRPSSPPMKISPVSGRNTPPCTGRTTPIIFSIRTASG